MQKVQYAADGFECNKYGKIDGVAKLNSERAKDMYEYCETSVQRTTRTKFPRSFETMS